jgi:hypothetical protein
MGTDPTSGLSPEHVEIRVRGGNLTRELALGPSSLPRRTDHRWPGDRRPAVAAVEEPVSTADGRFRCAGIHCRRVFAGRRGTCGVHVLNSRRRSAWTYCGPKRIFAVTSKSRVNTTKPQVPSVGIEQTSSQEIIGGG